MIAWDELDNYEADVDASSEPLNSDHRWSPMCQLLNGVEKLSSKVRKL